MSFTYNPANPDSDIEKIRLEIGDTDADNPLFQDEEIQIKLDTAGSVLLTAADCCDILATRYAARYDFRDSDASFSASQLSKAYAARALTLRKRGKGGITTLVVKKVDGYSDDVTNESVDSASTDPKRRFRTGLIDRIP